MEFPLSLEHGNPFSSTFAPPDALRSAYFAAKWQFRAGDLWALEDESPLIEEKDAADALWRALETLQSFLALPISNALDEDGPIDHSPIDGLPLALGRTFTDWVEATEDDDGVPPFTKLANGKWLTIRQHFAALWLLQLDRATSALRWKDANALAKLLCDTHELFEHMSMRDMEQTYQNLTEAPLHAAREHGRQGGLRRHRNTAALKAWALQEAASMRGSDMDDARALATRVPNHLNAASKDPERLIYEALRAARRRTQRG